MLAPRPLIKDITRQIAVHWRALIAFHLFFTLLATALWVPLSAGTLAGLLKRIGQPVLSNGQIVDVALSARGLLWLLAALGLPPAEIDSALRVSLSRDNDEEDGRPAFYGSVRSRRYSSGPVSVDA